MHRILLAVIASVFLTGEVFAYCSKPSQPYCASSYSDFSDEYEFNSCKRDMENYQQEVDSYVRCLQRNLDAAIEEAKDAVEEATSDAERNSQSAISEYNEAVESFNRRAN